MDKTKGRLEFSKLEEAFQDHFSVLEDVTITSFRRSRNLFALLVHDHYDEYIFGFSATVDGTQANFSCEANIFFNNPSDFNRTYPNPYSGTLEIGNCESANTALRDFGIMLSALGVTERAYRSGKWPVK